MAYTSFRVLPVDAGRRRHGIVEYSAEGEDELVACVPVSVVGRARDEA